MCSTRSDIRVLERVGTLVALVIGAGSAFKFRSTVTEPLFCSSAGCQQVHQIRLPFSKHQTVPPAFKISAAFKISESAVSTPTLRSDHAQSHSCYQLAYAHFAKNISDSANVSTSSPALTHECALASTHHNCRSDDNVAAAPDARHKTVIAAFFDPFTCFCKSKLASVARVQPPGKACAVGFVS